MSLYHRNDRSAGGETYAYYDADRTKIFVLVRYPPSKLTIFADSINFKMLLDPAKLEAKCKLGDPENRIAPLNIGHDSSLTHFEPYEYIYARYVSGLICCWEYCTCAMRAYVHTVEAVRTTYECSVLCINYCSNLFLCLITWLNDCVYRSMRMTMLTGDL